MTFARRIRRLAAAAGIAAALVGGTSTLHAQVSVSGTVFDSLITRAPLVGAQVVLEGVPGSSMTDRRGRFNFDGVAPGRYQATFFHPRLDSMSMSAPVVVLDVGERPIAGIRLATPSFATTSRALCGVEIDTTTSILLARIRDAEAGRPLPDALGEVSWWEMSFGVGAAPQRQSRKLVARADSTGNLTLCGVPNDIELAMSARFGSQATGDIVFPRGLPAVTVQELRISLSDTASRVNARAQAEEPIDTLLRPRGGSSALRVQVRTDRGVPIRGAAVTVRGQAVGGVTNDSGVVMILGVPAGSQTVEVRAIGRAPDRQVVGVAPRTETAVDFRLGAVATELKEYVVRGVTENAERASYERRRRAGNGRFLDEDDLDKLGRSANGLANLPGLRVPFNPRVPTGGPGWNSNAFPMVYLRGADGELCTPTMFVDGAPRVRFDGVELHALLQLAKRMEIYNRNLSVPPEFSNAFTACGVIVIWTT